MEGALEWLLGLQIGLAGMWCGLMWLVQVLVYPQFKEVPKDAFGGFHRKHMKRISILVVPLLAAEGLLAILIAGLLWESQPMLQMASVGLYLTGTSLTIARFIPLHGLLARPDGPRHIDRLIQLNTWRTAFCSARLLVVLLAALSH